MSGVENVGHGGALVRPKEARRRLGCGKTKFNETYVKTGRLTPVPIGAVTIAFTQAQLDSVIAEEIAASEFITRKITTRDAASGKFTKKFKAAQPA